MLPLATVVIWGKNVGFMTKICLDPQTKRCIYDYCHIIVQREIRSKDDTKFAELIFDVLDKYDLVFSTPEQRGQFSYNMAQKAPLMGVGLSMCVCV